MAGIKKTKKRRRAKKLKLVTFTGYFSLIAAAIFLFSSLALRTTNNRLSAQAQEISQEIATLQTQNDAIKVDIQTLANRDRVGEIASNEGLTMDNSNVITISDNTVSSRGE